LKYLWRIYDRSKDFSSISRLEEEKFGATLLGENARMCEKALLKKALIA
jgi:hypothetical protein